MQRKNLLFGESSMSKKASPLLFTKWDFQQVDYPKSSTNLLSQFNFSRVQPFNENAAEPFYTPPTENNAIPTPKAPVKHKKQLKKGDLRPKKLQYTEEELNGANVVADSGIHTQEKSADTPLLSRKQRTSKCNNKIDPPQKQLRKLRAKLDRIKVQSNDKENENCFVGTRTTTVTNTKNYVAQRSSSVAFNSNADVLSTCDSQLDWVEVLEWLQPRRDVGIWIECCRKTCRKWRYTEDFHDPVEVPKIWYCKMNSDKSVASCNVPEQHLPEYVKSELIMNRYNAGSIVWAQFLSYPWWPAIVNDCPDTYTYYKLPKNSLEPTSYYVTFLNEEKLECAWINKHKLKPFIHHKYKEMIKKTTYRGIDYEKLLKKAYDTATIALTLSILDRLKRFSFVALYRQRCDINNNSPSISDTTKTEVSSNMDTDVSEEIPCSNPKREQFTLKDYYLNVLCQESDTL